MCPVSVWVVAEHRNGEIREVTHELVSGALALGAGQVTAVLLGNPGETKPLAAALKPQTGAVLVIENSSLGGFNGAAMVRALASLAEERRPSVILGAHSAAGMEWAPALAARLGAPIVTDAVGLTWGEGRVSARRAVYGGKLQAKVRLAPAEIAVVTVRPGSFERSESSAGGSAVLEEVAIEIPASLGKRFLRWVQEAAGDVDITQADVLVSVGRGIGDKENLDVAENLARALGATVSCSRPVVDAHWLPKERQVGISGKTVKPKVYIALGISGAFQHVTAMKNSATIIAVNKDPKAPVFRVAHYGVVGDLFKIVPALTAAVKAARG
jgi:electron transfer flavoprotein alpha subunit